jgi:hypothetical protein
MMGGWEAPIWKEARRVLARSRDPVRLADREVETLPDDDDAVT